MFLYSTRAFDRYDCPIISIAVLADEDPNWRPNSFGYDDPDLPAFGSSPSVRRVVQWQRQGAICGHEPCFAGQILPAFDFEQLIGCGVNHRRYHCA